MQKNNFVLHEHTRGDNSHLDIRFEIENGLMGFTLDSDSLKLSNDASESNKILAAIKPIQPKEWLTVSGEIEPGNAGASKQNPTRFKILDTGAYELGVREEDILEVFMHGKRFDGRFLFEKLSLEKENNLKDKKAWFMWKPINQIPYVLGRKEFNVDHSALSAEWQEKIPAELKWWGKNWNKERIKNAIETARLIFQKRNMLTNNLHFSLHEKTTEKIKRYVLRLSNGIYYELDSNPLDKKAEINGIKKTFSDIGNSMNEKNNLLDKGIIDDIDSKSSFMRLKFTGTKLRGIWEAKKNNDFWMFSAASLQKPTPKIKNVELTEQQKAMILYRSKENNLSLSGIADEVGCSKASVIYHQRKMGLR